MYWISDTVFAFLFFCFLFLLAMVRKRYKGVRFAAANNQIVLIMFFINAFSLPTLWFLIIGDHVFYWQKDLVANSSLSSAMSAFLFFLFTSIFIFLTFKLFSSSFDKYKSRELGIREKINICGLVLISVFCTFILFGLSIKSETSLLIYIAYICLNSITSIVIGNCLVHFFNKRGFK